MPPSLTSIRPAASTQAEGMLDRYKNLSPKIHVQYIDYQKQPTVARAYGLRFAGTAYVEIGPRREEAKASNGRRNHRRLSQRSEGRSQSLLCERQPRASRSTIPTATASRNSRLCSSAITIRRKPLLCSTRPRFRPIAMSSSSLVRRSDYTANEVTAIKNYVENGGRGLFLLDPPLDFGREHIAENSRADRSAPELGRHRRQRPGAGENPMGQLFGFGPEIPLVSAYESHPIVNDLKSSFTGFPVARSLQVKNTDKIDRRQAVLHYRCALSRPTKLDSNEINPADPNNKKGPFVLGAAGTYNTGKPQQSGPFCGHRQLGLSRRMA